MCDRFDRFDRFVRGGGEICVRVVRGGEGRGRAPPTPPPGAEVPAAPPEAAHAVQRAARRPCALRRRGRPRRRAAGGAGARCLARRARAEGAPEHGGPAPKPLSDSVPFPGKMLQRPASLIKGAGRRNIRTRPPRSARCARIGAGGGVRGSRLEGNGSKGPGPHLKLEEDLREWRRRGAGLGRLRGGGGGRRASTRRRRGRGGARLVRRVRLVRGEGRGVST